MTSSGYVDVRALCLNRLNQFDPYGNKIRNLHARTPNITEEPTCEQGEKSGESLIPG